MLLALPVWRAARLVYWTGIYGSMTIGAEAAIAGPAGRWR
jgi:hypothetical protein